MIGAIAGDVIGSVYEHQSTKSTDFPLFHGRSRITDDSVLTVATAEAILEGGGYDDRYRALARRYPDAGYGATFYKWIFDEGMGPYNSWGNGSAMRVSPIGWVFSSPAEVLREAEASASVTHNHAEGIKGAQAVALAVFLSRTGKDKDAIRAELSERFGYDLQRTVEEIRPTYGFDVSCQGSVPEAIIAFLDSEDFEDAVRLAISLGGDADTQAAIAGSIAEAYYGGVPRAIEERVWDRIPEDLQRTISAFRTRFLR